MKNVLRSITLSAISVFALAGTAHAVVSSPVRFEYQTVRFITSAAATPNGGIVDSTVARRLGAAGASSVLDTTKAISTEGWLVERHKVLADTSGFFCQLMVSDAPGSDDDCESGADSLGVAMQVSPDGEHWLTAATLPAQTVSATTAPIASRNNQTIVNSAFHDRLSLNGAALANGKPVWVVKFKARGAQQLTEVAEGMTEAFPWIRFILSFHDAKGYKVQAKVAYLSGAVE